MAPSPKPDAYTRKGLRLLVCGGQHTPAHVLHQLLTRAHAKRRLGRVLESGEPGAQQAVGAWCQKVADGAVDAVLALPGDDPPGWAGQAEAAGLPVWRPMGVM